MFKTPWPVEAAQVNHNFLHIPLLLDDEKTQRCFNLPAKLPWCGRLLEDPFLMPLLSAMLKEDYVLSDISATSIGPHTDGGYWHIDAPLTQGSVVASDAFFPFADGLLEAAAAGATTVIQPGGSMRDEEVIAAADDKGLAMVFTGMRHFRH